MLVAYNVCIANNRIIVALSIRLNIGENINVSANDQEQYQLKKWLLVMSN